MKKNNISLIGGILFLCSILIVSCNKENDITSSNVNIAKMLNDNDSYSIFNYAVKKTRLNIFSEGGGPFTFFVPTNDAFKLSGINSTADIDKIDTITLANIIAYHFQGGKRTYNEIPVGPNATMSSQNGYTQYASRYSRGAFINGVALLDQGTPVSNGIIYSMREIIPYIYAGTNLDFLTLLGYTRMVQAINKAGIASSFTTTPSTIFAISNDVMVANGYDSITIAGLSGTPLTALSNILKYHVLPQRIFKSDFVSGSFQTRFTSNYLTIASTGNVTVRGKNNSAELPVSSPYLILPNSSFKYYPYTVSGVIYSVNGLLKP